ncbi:ComEA family DNA-binding protein [Chitinimonas sp. PSY-7]|uniref:helix-hairpin-helix domain-containing protein n=1 Tax=Chitinimonas sp. PSY-7 TaxID=3459088 RepID=UPI00403FFDBE
MKALFASVLAALALAVLPAMAVVDINKGTAAELEALPGIGPKKAQAIVDYRSKNGPFKTVEDMEKVKGIGKATVEKLRKDITVGGAPSKPAPAPTAASKPASASPPKKP